MCARIHTILCIHGGKWMSDECKRVYELSTTHCRENIEACMRVLIQPVFFPILHTSLVCARFLFRFAFTLAEIVACMKFELHELLSKVFQHGKIDNKKRLKSSIC